MLYTVLNTVFNICSPYLVLTSNISIYFETKRVLNFILIRDLIGLFRYHVVITTEFRNRKENCEKMKKDARKDWGNEKFFARKYYRIPTDKWWPLLNNRIIPDNPEGTRESNIDKRGTAWWEFFYIFEVTSFYSLGVNFIVL